MSCVTGADHDARPIVIMDTNALLDWRVFKDPAAHPIAQAIIA